MSRRNRFHTRFLAALSVVGCSLTFTGCATQPVDPVPAEPVHSAPRSPRKGEISPTRLADGNELDAQTDDYAKRLAQAIEARNNPGSAEKPAATPASAERAGSVEWVDDKYLRTANPPRVEAEPAPKPAAIEPKKVETVEPAAKPPVTPAAAPPAATQGTTEREALLKLIRDRVTNSHDASVDKAMSLAGLALIDPTFKLDEKELAQLPPTQRELVRQFHDLFTSLGQQVASGQAVDRSALGDRLSAIIGEQPLAIRTIKLCDRVRSFGVYEELASDTFLAGREQPMVVYIELDHFKSVKTGETHEVKLSQELVLYNESDGLAVWRQPEQQIVDESRNRRRDFYVVQPTRLPARLGVGKFVLKVRVRDLHGGTRDEVSLPINIVADPALVKPDVKKNVNGKAG